MKLKRDARLSVVLAGLFLVAVPAIAQGPPPTNTLAGRDTGPLQSLRQRIRDKQASLSPQERQGWEMLQRMVKADMTVPFIAREVRLNRNGKETELWVRWEPRRGARLESIRPAGEIVVDDKTNAFVFNPQKREWTQRGSMLAQARKRVGDIARRLLKGELTATREGQDTIAGRTADIVRVAPANGVAGPSRRFWIDRITGLRLRSENVAPEGRILNSSYYLSVDLAPTFREDDFTAPQNVAHLIPPNKRTFRSAAEAVQAGYPVRQPGYLPPAFTLQVVEVTAAGTPHQQITQRYANGLSVISLTQTPPDARQLKPTGALGAGFLPIPRGGGGERAYVWRDANTRYVLLGTISEEEMKRIADSVR
jgi:negative regulator of sigma E activity